MGEALKQVTIWIAGATAGEKVGTGGRDGEKGHHDEHILTKLNFSQPFDLVLSYLNDATTNLPESNLADFHWSKFIFIHRYPAAGQIHVLPAPSPPPFCTVLIINSTTREKCFRKGEWRARPPSLVQHS